jgi:glycoside/pentoside/hexuronide:cation symporter, GPH family
LSARDDKKLPASLLAAYALPALPAAMLGLPLLIFLPAYYVETTALSLTAIGTVLLVARLWDVAVDPAIGALSDRTRTPFGRRKPWILAALPVVLLGSFMLFDPPTDAGAGYLLLWLLVVYLGWSMVQIPHQAWGAELSSDYAERSRIAAWRESLTVVGVAIAASLPTVAVQTGILHPGDSPEGFALHALVVACAILLPIAAFVLLRYVPEPKAVAAASGFDVRAGWHLLRDNLPFRRLVIAYLVNGVANALPATLFLLYAGSVLGAGDQSGAFLLVYFVSGIAAVPLWLRASKLWSKHRAWSASMIAACGAFAFVPFLGNGDHAAFLAICLLTGLCFGADLALPASMQADVVDVDTAGGGGQRTGLYFAIWSVATKLALALAPALAFPALDAAGFVANDPASPGHAMLAFLYAGVPVVFKLGAAYLIWNFPLDAAAQTQLRARIAERAGIR